MARVLSHVTQPNIPSVKCVFSADLRYVCDTGKEWVCKTCDRALKRGVMPLQAKANGLQLTDIPTELFNLNA